MNAILSSTGSKEDLFTKLTDVVSLFSKIYGSAGLVLFAILTWITSAYFSNLHTQMVVISHGFNRNNSHHHQLTSGLISNKAANRTLIKWRRIHVLLLETVSCIEHCFGPLLFIWIIFSFINLISNSFYIVDDIRRFGLHLSMWLSMSLINLIKLSINFFICTKVPAMLSQEVINYFKNFD